MFTATNLGGPRTCGKESRSSSGILVLQGPKVEYSLRAIPLGGFVGFPDDDPKSEFKPDDPDLLRNRSIPGRLTVMSAGIIANCIFAFSVLFIQVSVHDQAW